MQHFYLAIILLLLLIGCKSDITSNQTKEDVTEIEKKLPHNLIDLQIDSFYSVNLKTDRYSFVRLIPAQKNTLWHFNRRNLIEIIDLTNPNNIFQPELSKKLTGSVYSDDDVTLDSRDPATLWISNNYNGLFKYNATIDSFIPTSINQCNTLFELPQTVICVSRDLKILHKETNKIDTITKFAGQHIFDVRESEKFGLAINGHSYDPLNKTFKKITQINGHDVEDGFNSIIEKDSFIVYSPGRTVNAVNVITNNNHYQDEKIASSKHRVIENNALWYLKKGINQWNLNYNTTQNYSASLPTKSHQTYLNDKGRYWILTAKEIFSFDRSLKTFYQHPQLANKNEVLQSFLDEKHLYVLYDNELVIYNKDYLEQEKKDFNVAIYTDQKKEYLSYIDSIQLYKSTSFPIYQYNVENIENKFQTFLNIHKKREYLELRETINQSEKFRESFYSVILTNDKIDPRILKENYTHLAKALATNGKIDQVKKLDKLISDKYKQIKLLATENYQYKDGIEKIEAYYRTVDSLEKTDLINEELDFQKIIAFKEICYSSWFCHEGCGGCNLSLVIHKINEFIKSNPHSDLVDDAQLELIQVTNMYEEDPGGFILGYEKFLVDFPSSPLRLKVLKQLLPLYSYQDYPLPKYKKMGQRIIQVVKNEFSEYAKEKEFIQYENAINKN